MTFLRKRSKKQKLSNSDIRRFADLVKYEKFDKDSTYETSSDDMSASCILKQLKSHKITPAHERMNLRSSGQSACMTCHKIKRISNFTIALSASKPLSAWECDKCIKTKVKKTIGDNHLPTTALDRKRDYINNSKKYHEIIRDYKMSPIHVFKLFELGEDSMMMSNASTIVKRAYSAT